MPHYHQKNEFGSVAAQRTGHVQRTSRQNIFQESFLNVSYKYTDQVSTNHQVWEGIGLNWAKIKFSGPGLVNSPISQTRTDRPWSVNPWYWLKTVESDSTDKVNMKNILDEPASLEPKLEEIFQLRNRPPTSMETSIANASKTLDSMDISSG